MVLVCDLLERLLPSRRQLRQLDVHAGPDGGTQVGGAEGEEAEAVVVAEFELGLDGVDGADQAAIDLTDVAALR